MRAIRRQPSVRIPRHDLRRKDHFTPEIRRSRWPVSEVQARAEASTSAKRPRKARSGADARNHRIERSIQEIK